VSYPEHLGIMPKRKGPSDYDIVFDCGLPTDHDALPLHSFDEPLCSKDTLGPFEHSRRVRFHTQVCRLELITPVFEETDSIVDSIAREEATERDREMRQKKLEEYQQARELANLEGERRMAIETGLIDPERRRVTKNHWWHGAVVAMYNKRYGMQPFIITAFEDDGFTVYPAWSRIRVRKEFRMGPESRFLQPTKDFVDELTEYHPWVFNGVTRLRKA
jgi:hypothetical protein